MKTKTKMTLALTCLITVITAQSVQAAGTASISPIPVTPFDTSVHTIGEHYAGGIVFYVYDNGRHGLIAAKVNQSSGIQWYNGVYKATGATGEGVGAGARNTTLIIAAQINDRQNGSFAAKVAADYSIQEDGVTACPDSGFATQMAVITTTCYGDWYLPSQAELHLLYQQKNVLNLTRSFVYWSSTEINPGLALSFTHMQIPSNTKNLPLPVRAIRAF